MIVTRTNKGKKVKIIAKGNVYFMALGEWVEAYCQHKGCYEKANNLYWHEAFLCERHFQENREKLADRYSN